MHSHIGCKDAIDEILLRQVESALELIVVEGDLSRAGAVQPSLCESGPCILKKEAATNVILTDARHPRVHRLPTVMLHCILPQEEEGEQPDIVGWDELRLWEKEGDRMDFD